MAANHEQASLLLKALSLAAIIGALAEPVITVARDENWCRGSGRHLAERIRSDLDRENSLVNAISHARGRNWMSVIPFAERGAINAPGGPRSPHLWRTSFENGQATDLEAALREGFSSIPSGPASQAGLDQ